MFNLNSSNFTQQLQNQDFVNNYMDLISTSYQLNPNNLQIQYRPISLLEASPFSNCINPGSFSNSWLFDLETKMNNKNQYSALPVSNAPKSTSLGFSNPFHHQSNFNSNSGEKLAITGNIFEKRADWSIIHKLPIEKQNTIHIRTKDEGPYGNDEIRCFVLSHLSSLKIKHVPCVFCTCNMLVYDRFPIVDGTLFISPYDYDKSKSIPTRILEKPEKHQFMYGVCLDCITSKKNHQINCKFCNETWQNIGGSSLQIGTLYKYDIVAAFPCCQCRLNCKNCNSGLIKIDAAKQKYFSSFSDKIQCPSCAVMSFHFLKPISTIYNALNCQKNKNFN